MRNYAISKLNEKYPMGYCAAFGEKIGLPKKKYRLKKDRAEAVRQRAAYDIAVAATNLKFDEMLEDYLAKLDVETAIAA